MAFESVRSYVQLASGLGEMTMARAMEAAQGLLALPGADEVTRRAVQASALADQLLEAARSNRAGLIALVQSEVEAALKHADVARVADVEAARTAVTALAKELHDLRDAIVATGASAITGITTGRGTDSTPAPAAPAPTSPTAPRPAKKATAKKTAAKKATAKKAATTKAAPAKKAAAKRPTRKAGA